MTPTDFKQARQSLGLKQDPLAEILGVQRGHISRMENGHIPITAQTSLIMRAMVAFGLPHLWPAVQ